MNEIIQHFIKKDPIDADGRVFLSDRGLSIQAAIDSKRVASFDGYIYFLYSDNEQPPRWKRRSLTNKKDQSMSTLTPEEKEKYRMPFYNAQIWPKSDYIILTEGELDCLALSQLGAKQVASLPNGASSVESAIRNNYEWLQKFDKIYIAFDMDEPGEIAANKAKAMISPHKFRRIRFDYKDANEWVQNEPSLEFQDLENLMRNAEGSIEKNFTKLSQIDGDAFNQIDLGYPTPFENLNNILGGLRRKEITVLTAQTGAGKTTFSIQLMYHLAKNGIPVWINSYEMHNYVVMRKFACKILGKDMKYEAFTSYDKGRFLAAVEELNIFINTKSEVVNIDVLRNQFEKASLAYGCKYILIDHLDYLHSTHKRNNAFESVDDVMKALHILAMEFDVGVILVAHPKQQQTIKELSKDDIKGSSAIKQYADNVLILTRMSSLGNHEDTRVKIKVDKNRTFGIEKPCFLTYEREIDGFTETLKGFPNGNNQL